MKNYMVFAGESYYPNGGMYDFKDSFDTLEEAIQYVANIKCDWWHVFSIADARTVKEGIRS